MDSCLNSHESVYVTSLADGNTKSCVTSVSSCQPDGMTGSGWDEVEPDVDVKEVDALRRRTRPC